MVGTRPVPFTTRLLPVASRFVMWMTHHPLRYAGVMAAPRWLNEREQRAWRGFLRVQAHLMPALGRRLQAHAGLSLADYHVLVALTDAPEGRLRVLDLARAADWEQSRLSHHLTRMARRGLIERTECPEDGRGAFIVLTPAGRQAVEAAAPRHVEDVRTLVFDQLTPEQVDALTEVSDRILQALEQR